MTVTTEGKAKAASQELVTLTIDGIEISVPKGTLVIRAAEQLGIEIPRFCDHPLLDPAGASSGWSQNRGISMPSCSATRISSAPFGAVTSMPSMVRVTRSSGGRAASPPPEGALVVTVMRSPPYGGRPRPWTWPGRRGSRGP